jgi:chromosome segregation ATPase
VCRGLAEASRRERGLKDAVAQLQRTEGLGGDVLGRMGDVCEPLNARADGTAIAVLMGRHMDSVVVQTFAAAQRCVAELKQHRMDPIEFIPLDKIQVQASRPLHCRDRLCILQRSAPMIAAP